MKVIYIEKGEYKFRVLQNRKELKAFKKEKHDIVALYGGFI